MAPYYINTVHTGIGLVSSYGDGYSINVRWNKAYPNIKTNGIAYNLYYSTDQNTVFYEGPKFVSINNELHANVLDLIPGQLYHFAVRAVEYNPELVNPSQLIEAYEGLRFYPESVLTENISATDLIVPLLSTETFPSYGVIQAGIELINYLANDTINNNLIVAGGPAPVDARFAIQPDGYYYQPGTNTGDGIISNLALLNSNAPAETWTIKCIFVQRNNFGQSIPGTAKFETIGSVSGNVIDGYGNYLVWDVYNTVLSNGIISFSIQEETPAFIPGDTFTIQVIGAIAGMNGRGFENTIATEHLTDGYDGYVQWSPYIRYALGSEEFNTIVFPCQNRFDIRHDQLTITSGYHQVTEDYLTTNLSASDAFNQDFAPFDYAGWRRTDPVELLSGACVGSYFGGEQFCADGYSGVGRMLRGLSFQQRNNQRQEYLLSLTGEPVCLIKRMWTGITCDCYLPSSEYPDDRCSKCFGSKFVVGWEQFFDPRRSDGRIMVRFSPADDDLKPYEGGLESELTSDVWTLTVPTVKDRDFIVRFDQDNNEEYRYEILSVNRNRTLTQLEGAQKFKVQRVRKFDPIYTVPVFRNTQYFPSQIITTPGDTIGIPAHTHTLQINEDITSITQINQLTSISFGHTHDVYGGVVQERLHHTHQIILPPPIIPTQ
jgi:hypothetical protein